MALMAGNAELANQYKQRAYNYQKSFLNGYARPRYKDGRWKKTLISMRLMVRALLKETHLIILFCSS